MKRNQFWAAAGRALTVVPAIALALSAALSAQVQTEPNWKNSSTIVVYTFTGQADGMYPRAGLIRDQAGNFYGVAQSGTYGGGTVFKLDETGALSVLYSFAGAPDGERPVAALTRDAVGNLYGTTEVGGDPNCSIYGHTGCGTVFKVDSTGKETILHRFSGGADGAYPTGGLVLDYKGNVYGTTSSGGSGGVYGMGVVFKVDTNGKFTVLHTFDGWGANPSASMILHSGVLYGTTVSGNAGTIFKMDKSGRNFALLYMFSGADGAHPSAELFRDTAGNLYGTTAEGGEYGAGTVFKLDTTGKLTVLHSLDGGHEGSRPLAGVVRDYKGNLYGTTWEGGDNYYGTVFKVDSTDILTVLHTFAAGQQDGATPFGTLVRDRSGWLYGITESGGSGPYGGCGIVFKLHP